MSRFATRVEQVSISGIREVFEAASEDSINLGLGQPDFPAPDHVHEAASDAIRAGEADAYTSNKGRPELREAIADYHDREHDLAVDPENLIVTAGGSEALYLAIAAHVDPGEEVLIPDPGFVSYEALTRLADATPRTVPVRDDLSLDPAAVEDAITPETAMFVVNSPANPTGAVQSEADMQAFARIADEHDIVCLTDEVYERIRYGVDHHSPMADGENVVMVNACSKTYSMTGWRLGWVAADHDRIERMLRAHQYVQACASAPAQFAAEAALTGTQDAVDEMVAAFERRRDVVLDGLSDMGLRTPTPEGAFYAMPEVPEGWVEAVLERDVIVVPGEAFGPSGAGHARISYATDVESIKEALEAMRAATEAVR
ncbi:pyridoxal phosphate-dependent aminotransferase [Halococcoides cellulosivorans]|uniref:Aspartate aminotransferase n=1 Tax=Halococcoides cellulosivorans TaxID=1679096 RepID=A0A2R4X188_9EURY|nr:pyridoxal phosphate-dependent aminotransferase [Halococcoides cellulosivorans]AWB27551.1 aspartate aminotransferase [Halococcoides cellulosivorans]